MAAHIKHGTCSICLEPTETTFPHDDTTDTQANRVDHFVCATCFGAMRRIADITGTLPKCSICRRTARLETEVKPKVWYVGKFSYP
jgi:hypothetical protein